MYFRSRYYCPIKGSFVSRDPLMYVDGYSSYLGYFGSFSNDPSGKEIYIVIDPSKKKDKDRTLVINNQEVEGATEYKKAFEAIIEVWNKDIDKYIAMANRAPDTAKITLNGEENAKKADVIAALKNHRINEKIIVLPVGKAAAAKVLTDLANGLTENDQILYETHTHSGTDAAKLRHIHIGNDDLFLNHKDIGKISKEFKSLFANVSKRTKITFGACNFDKATVNGMTNDLNFFAAGFPGYNHPIFSATSGESEDDKWLNSDLIRSSSKKVKDENGNSTRLITPKEWVLTVKGPYESAALKGELKINNK